METFKATKYEEDKLIELSDSKELVKLFKTIEDSENFILEWTDGTTKHSEIIISCDMVGKVKSGDVKLTAKEATKK